MNYIKEINAFYDWLLYNSLSTGAVALWHALMSINNKADWADEFTVANIVLQGMTGLSRQGLNKARNILIQKGLIQYKKGTSNQAGKYTIISLVRQKVDTVTYTEENVENFDRKKVGTAVDAVVGTVADTKNLECKKVVAKGSRQGRSSSHSSSTLYKQNETKLNNNIYIQSNSEYHTQPMEENVKATKKVFEHWNEKCIIKHRRLNDKILLAINTALNDYSVDDICQAIDNYAVILFDDKYYWSYKFTLNEFVEKSLDKFLDFDTAATNYTKNQNTTATNSKLNKIPDFNKYAQHEYTDEQLEQLFEEIG